MAASCMISDDEDRDSVGALGGRAAWPGRCVDARAGGAVVGGRRVRHRAGGGPRVSRAWGRRYRAAAPGPTRDAAATGGLGRTRRGRAPDAAAVGAGEVLPEQAHDIWVREHPDGPWRFQLMLDEADEEEWIFRRDPRIRRPLAGLTVEQDGFRWLVPEVQLLYKSKGLRPKDEADFEAVLPLLSEGQRRWLDEALGTEQTTHPWRERLAPPWLRHSGGLALARTPLSVSGENDQRSRCRRRLLTSLQRSVRSSSRRPTAQ